VLACVSFFTFVQPSLNGENGWRVYADSDVYMNIADYIRSQEEGVAAVELMSFARNLLLPAYVALSLKTAVNIFASMCSCFWLPGLAGADIFFLQVVHFSADHPCISNYLRGFADLEQGDICILMRCGHCAMV